MIDTQTRLEAAEEVVERLDLAVENAVDDLSSLSEQIEIIDLDTHLCERFDLVGDDVSQAVHVLRIQVPRYVAAVDDLLELRHGDWLGSAALGSVTVADTNLNGPIPRPDTDDDHSDDPDDFDPCEAASDALDHAADALRDLQTAAIDTIGEIVSAYAVLDKATVDRHVVHAQALADQFSQAYTTWLDHLLTYVELSGRWPDAHFDERINTDLAALVLAARARQQPSEQPA